MKVTQNNDKFKEVSKYFLGKTFRLTNPAALQEYIDDPIVAKVGDQFIVSVPSHLTISLVFKNFAVKSSNTKELSNLLVFSMSTTNLQYCSRFIKEFGVEVKS